MLLMGAGRGRGRFVGGGDMVTAVHRMQKGEILTLKWNEVRFDEDCISLLDTKNGRSRMVHLNAWAREVVERTPAREQGQ